MPVDTCPCVESQEESPSLSEDKSVLVTLPVVKANVEVFEEWDPLEEDW